MSTQITIHGKRVETVYAFTVEYKGETITGRYIQVNGVDEDESLGLPEVGEKIEFDDPFVGDWLSSKDELYKNKIEQQIKQAIEDYEKIHKQETK